MHEKKKKSVSAGHKDYVTKVRMSFEAARITWANTLLTKASDNAQPFALIHI